ncbi:MAG: phosphodiester glycosidase family protein [Hominenteromicrobium sp.]
MNHNINLTGYTANCGEPNNMLDLGTAGSYGIEKLHVTADAAWDGLTITATFTNSGSTTVAVSDGAVDVPPEATRLPTRDRVRYGMLAFKGADADGSIRIISTPIYYKVQASAATDGENTIDPTPDQYAQFVAEVTAEADRAEAAAERAEAAGSTVSPEQITQAVNDYLDENPVQATPIDATLTQSGQAADAKAVGDAIAGIELTPGPAGANGTDGKSAYQYAQEGGFTGTEEEFASKLAAELPEKLPNPYALTFTGAASGSYDGSAAVEVEIPSGGSGKTALDTFMDNTDIDYLYDEATGAYYTVIRVYKQKLDGSCQFPFVYAPNGSKAGDKSTYDMTMGEGWLLAVNSGIFNTSTKKPDGIVIQNGTVIQSTPSAVHSQCKPLTIDSSGNLGYADYDADAEELAAAGVVSAVCGFMPIVVDYAAVDSSEWNSVSHYTENAQRQIIGQWGNGDYAVITCEGRGYHNSDGWTIAEAQAVCIKHGLKFAYNLDGGGSTETMLGQKPVNTIYENATGRIVPTFIVFDGTTVPPAADETGGSGDEETEKVLTGISAAYSGGDVPVGTAVTELTGIVVTAAYDDGSTETVTGYTLSGTIAEGENTLTVTYVGLTATFTVTGVTGSGGDASFEPVYLIGYSNMVNGTPTNWNLAPYNNRMAAVTTEQNLDNVGFTIGDAVYYPIPVPIGATKVIVTCPGFIPGDRYYSYNADTEIYASLFDAGWQSEGGVTREFAAGTYAYMTVNFKNSGNSEISADTDTSGFSIVFE